MVIKRNGVELMNARTKNVSIAKETIKVIAEKKYISPTNQVVDISQAIDDCINKTALYSSYLELPNTNWETLTPTVEVVNETTAQSAVRLLQEGKENIVALNFASAHTPGGGFRAGAVAQEEDLCRASALYASLKKKSVFYNENILCENMIYTNNIIYSPNVPFFRDHNNLFIEEPFTLSIISSPAPNIRGMNDGPPGAKVSQEDIPTILYGRALKVLETAACHGHQNIILGAWGCGAYGNDPQMVAKVFKLALEKVPAFQHVCFAVYDVRDPPMVFEAFRSVFTNEVK